MSKLYSQQKQQSMQKQMLMQETKGTQVSFPIILSSVKEKEEESNRTLFKNDSLSSDEASRAPALPSKIKVNSNAPELDQIKKFLRKGDALNTTTLRRLNEDKQINQIVKHDRSSASLYKTSRHNDFVSLQNPKQKEIKRIYLSNNKAKPKFFFRASTYKQSKLSQQVQTDNLQQNITIQSRRDLFQYPAFNYSNIHQMSYNTIDVIGQDQLKRKAQKVQQSIEVKQDEQVNKLLPLRDKKSGMARAKALSGRASVQNYLQSMSKVQYNFHSGVNKINNRYRQYQQQQTIFSKTIDIKPLIPMGQTLNSFEEKEPIIQKKQNKEQIFINNVVLATELTQQSQVSKIQNIKPVTISEKPKIQQMRQTVNGQKQKNKLQIYSSKKIDQSRSQEQWINKNDKQYSIPLTFVAEQLPVDKEVSMIAQESQNISPELSSKSRGIPSRITQTLLSITPVSPQRRQGSPKRKQRNQRKQQNSILIQVPSLHQLKIGDQEPIHKSYHPIRQSFGNKQVDWMKNQYRPKNELFQNMSAINMQIKKYKNGVYFGQLDAEGHKNGKGIIFYFSGKIYQGELKTDLKHGKGHQYFPDGSNYRGDYVNGTKQGKGIFQWSNGEVYDGQWEGGKKNGSGMWKGQNGQSYIGQWKNGKVQGFGVFVMQNGSRYQGQFKNSLKHGLGTERFYNGQTYVGSYQKNRPNGQGQYYWANGDYYKGQFSNGLRHGHGYFRQGKSDIEYRGEYKNDKKCGYGQINYGNQITYVGNFQNNYRHGYGELSQNNKFKYRGYWINDHEVDQSFSQPNSVPKDNKKSNVNTNKSSNVNTHRNLVVHAAPRLNTIINQKQSRTTNNLSQNYSNYKTGRPIVSSIQEEEMQRQESLPKMLAKGPSQLHNHREHTHSERVSPQNGESYQRPCGCNKKH